MELSNSMVNSVEVEEVEAFLSSLRSHRSIRAYRSDPVSEEVLGKILNAATRASSSGNMQAYSIIVTTDEEIKRQL